MSPGVTRKITSWMMNERQRLAALGLEKQATNLAHDLAQLLVDDINSRDHIGLQLVGRPDQHNRNEPAPDLLYEDKSAGIRAVFEVTRPLVGVTEQGRHQRQRFLQEVCSYLSPSFVGAYGVWLPPLWRPSRPGSSGRADLCCAFAVALEAGAQTLSQLNDERPATVRLLELVMFAHGPSSSPGFSWIAEQAILLPEPPGATAVRYDDTTQPPELTDLTREHPWLPLAPGERPREEGDYRGTPGVFEEWYRGILRDSDRKLAAYHCDGCETFLLFDCRLGDHLYSHSPRDLAFWHEEARGQAYGLNLGPIKTEDFAHIGHIVAFSIRHFGIEATAIHQALDSRLKTPRAWIIRPRGWYDKQ